MHTAAPRRRLNRGRQFAKLGDECGQALLTTMARIEIHNKNASARRCSPRSHSDVRVGPGRPPSVNLLLVRRGVFQPMHRAWVLPR